MSEPARGAEADGARPLPREGPGWRISPAGRIWVVTVALAAVGWLVFHLAVGAHGAFYARSWSWPGVALLAVLFFGTEVFVVHLHLANSTHSVSLLEIPLVLGLFFVAPPLLISAHLLGSAAALVLHRRQPAIKLCFNLVSFLVADELAVMVFCVVSGSSGRFGPRPTLGAFAAAPAASVLSVLLVFAAISVTEQTRDNAWLVSTATFGVMSALFSTSLGLIAVAVLTAYPGAAWLLLIPSVGLYLANSAHASERRRHEGLEFLYESTRLLHQSPELETALGELLRNARRIFRAEFAELTYRATDAGQAMDAFVTAGQDQLTVRVIADDTLGPLWRFLEEQPSTAALWREQVDADIAALLVTRGIETALVTPLQDEGRVVGFLLLGNNERKVERFDDEDLRLLETLANHVVVALENGRLEQSLDQLQRLERQLSHQATHDPLTSWPTGCSSRSSCRTRWPNRRGAPPRSTSSISTTSRR